MAVRPSFPPSFDVTADTGQGISYEFAPLKVEYRREEDGSLDFDIEGPVRRIHLTTAELPRPEMAATFAAAIHEIHGARVDVLIDGELA